MHQLFQAMRITEAGILLERTGTGYLLQLRQLRVWQLLWHQASEADAHPSPEHQRLPNLRPLDSRLQISVEKLNK